MTSSQGKEQEPTGRARSVPELFSVMSRFSTAESRAQGLAFRPRPTDVFIATYPKSGTTLMQQVVHGLRTAGDLNFREITQVVPWIELALDLEIDPDAEQRADPRAFKTHLSWRDLPKGGRSIYLVRDPNAVLLSFYDFFSGWFFERDAIDFETFALDFVLARKGGADYWTHLVSWWPQRHDPNVLYLFYEDVVADLAASVSRVAHFVGAGTDDETLALATRQAHRDFMRQFPTLWDDNLLREKRNPVMGIPVEASSAKVRAAHENPSGTVLPERVATVWQERWAEQVMPVTGEATYEALRQRVRQEAASR